MLTFTHCLRRSFTARLLSPTVSARASSCQLHPFFARANSSFSGHNSVARLQHTYASWSSPEMLASAIAAPYKTELLDSSKAITAKLNRQPRLRGILANADEPSRVYAESTKKSCDEVGIEYELVSIGSEESPSQAAEVEQAVLEANMDDNVDGIMIYFPIFGQQKQTHSNLSYLMFAGAVADTSDFMLFFFCSLQVHRKTNTSSKSSVPRKTSKVYTSFLASTCTTTSAGSSPKLLPLAKHLPWRSQRAKCLLCPLPLRATSLMPRAGWSKPSCRARRWLSSRPSRRLVCTTRYSSTARGLLARPSLSSTGFVCP